MLFYFSYILFETFFLVFILSDLFISYIDIFCPLSLRSRMFHPHFIPLLSFLLSNLFVNNMLLSVTFFPAFHLLFVLITQFRLHETFPSLIVLSFSQYLLFSIFLSTSHFSICLLFVLPDLFSLH